MDNFSSQRPAEIKAYFFGSDLIQSIIDQDGAVGMRVYLGLDDTGKLKMVLLGSREDGSNIWPLAAEKSSPGVTGDTGYPCPPYC
jgi:hypothetical protein